MRIKEAWFEVIPAGSMDSYAMSGNGVYIHSTKQEVEQDIQDVISHYREQVEAGERDEQSCRFDAYPKKVFLTETGSILNADKQNITGDILDVMMNDAGITDASDFISEITTYVTGQ